jgi:hypothetical protein
MLGRALDVATRLEEKTQLSCEVLINKAEVSLKTFRKRVEITPAQRSGRNFCRLHSFRCLYI